MSSKNKSFVAGLVGAVDPIEPVVDRSGRVGLGILAGRNNRLAELASGSVVNMPQELVDPARCRIWVRHNRDYAALNEDRCGDLIESIVAQGKQEVPAIVRRISGDPAYDFEVICGARRHWSVAWLRAHHHPDIRYLVEIRDLTDEQAFRVSDLENRARQDLSDLERARDYLQALELYYDGRQKDMARRLNQSEAWLSRYLDLARLPSDVVAAFPEPFELKISHITALKPILKPEDSRAAVMTEARTLYRKRIAGEGGLPATAPDVIRALIRAAERPKQVAAMGADSAPKKTGMTGTILRAPDGVPLLRIDGKDRKGVAVTFLTKAGGKREDVNAALVAFLDQHWRE